MPSVEEAVQELHNQSFWGKQSLAGCYAEQVKKPTMAVPQLVYGAAYALADDVFDFIIRATRALGAVDPEGEVDIKAQLAEFKAKMAKLEMAAAPVTMQMPPGFKRVGVMTPDGTDKQVEFWTRNL